MAFTVEAKLDLVFGTKRSAVELGKDLLLGALAHSATAVAAWAAAAGGDFEG